MIGVDIAHLIHGTYSNAGVVAAVAAQQGQDRLGTHRVSLPCLQVYVDGIGMVADQEDFLRQATAVEIDGAVTDVIDDLPRLAVADIALSQVVSPAGVGQVIETNTVYALLLRQGEDPGDLIAVQPGDGHPERYPLPHGNAVADTLQRRLERSLFAPEEVVRVADAIKADPHLSEALAAHGGGHLLSYQGAVGGHYYPEALPGGELGKLEEVGSHHWLTTGEEDNRNAERGQLADQGLAFIGGHLCISASPTGVGIAVHAIEVAFPGTVPHHHWPWLGYGLLFAAIAQVVARSNVVAQQP